LSALQHQKSPTQFHEDPFISCRLLRRFHDPHAQDDWRAGVPSPGNGEALRSCHLYQGFFLAPKLLEAVNCATSLCRSAAGRAPSVLI